MLLSSLKIMGYKHLMRVFDICRKDVFLLNGGGYNPRGDHKHHIHLFESAYLTHCIS